MVEPVSLDVLTIESHNSCAFCEAVPSVRSKVLAVSGMALALPLPAARTLVVEPSGSPHS